MCALAGDGEAPMLVAATARSVVASTGAGGAISTPIVSPPWLSSGGGRDA